MTPKKIIAIAGSAILALSLAACADGNSGTSTEASGESEGESYTIKFAHVVSPDTTQQEAYVKFQELVEEQSDGRISVEIYPDGALGGEREMVESTQSGDIQMTAPSVGVLANFDKSLEVFDFPFIFPDKETAYEVLDSDVGVELLDGIADSGLLALGYGENGFRQLSGTDKPLVSPADVSGMKLRTMEVPLHIAYWKYAGANPTPMPFTEVFTGLSQGVVTGVENPLQLIYTGKFHEPSPFVTMTGHIYDPEIILINKAFLEGLSADDQEIIQDAVNESITHLRGLNAELEADLRDKLESEGATITDLTDAERQVWIDDAVGFYEANADKVDTDKLAALLEGAGNDKFLDAIK